ncbi:superoxide dismutase, partial [Cercophora newfieldiana]
MRTSAALSLLLAAAGTQVAAQTSVSRGNATIVKGNPEGVVYEAVFPDTPFFKAAYPDGGNIKGSIRASTPVGGEGVVFTINWTNLPKAGGPFMYHLHVAPVPENGNCTATLAHLDPFERGEDPVCDKEHPETCQTGDLSGKIGDITGNQSEFSTTYKDLYSANLKGLGSFFGNRSIVFHYANKTRVSCANFTLVAG